jgi:hypothetical protein
VSAYSLSYPEELPLLNSIFNTGSIISTFNRRCNLRKKRKYPEKENPGLWQEPDFTLKNIDYPSLRIFRQSYFGFTQRNGKSAD